ncbi:MAG: hypothetical protein ABIN25_01080, partial [Ginsengibacter sp.]
MQKKLITIASLLIITVLFLFSCTKEVREFQENNAPVSSINERNENSCRLVYHYWEASGTWQFQYNSKGLADKWIIDYGYGYPLHINEMTYDDHNRLIHSNEVLFDLHYVYDFYYSDKRISRLVRTSVEFPEQVQDFLFRYNKKGDLIRQDDNLNDEHVVMTYDAMGNCTQGNIYLGKELWWSDNYTFYAPVKNPRTAIPGITIGFPFYGGTDFTNKRWFTSN